MKRWGFYIVIFVVGLIVYSIIPNIKQQLYLTPTIIVYSEPVYNVFWTGGYDSTFLVLYLLKYGNVQPVYLRGCIDNIDCSKNRQSQGLEEKAMDEIRQSIQSKYILLPTIFADNIKLDEQIKRAAHESHKVRPSSRLIGQYTHMAQYCKDNDCIAHVSICNDDILSEDSSTLKLRWQQVPLIDKGTTHCRNETIEIFKQFRFPCIHLSKEEMRLLVNNDDVLKKTWTCRVPVNNMPCGTCSLCKERII